MAAFLTDWGNRTRYDLSASEAASMRLVDLLQMADAEDLDRWQTMDLGYASPFGAPFLRAAIAQRHPGWDPANILCCAGAQEGLTSVMQALLRPTDHAIVVVPVYQPVEQAVTSICEATGIPLRPHQNWQLDLNAIEAAIRPTTRLILINFPNSPTGAAIDSARLASLVALCRHHGIWLVNDEIYRSLGNPSDNCPLPVAVTYERGISIDAVSKCFGLPGLRVGWILCQDQAMLAAVMRAKSALSSSLAKPSEILAHIALKAEGTIIRSNRAITLSNRRHLHSVLTRHPDFFDPLVPGEGVLAFPSYRGPEAAGRFAIRLARDAGVLVFPSDLWHSPLAAVPPDHLRIGLGPIEAATALSALDAYLATVKTRLTP